MSLLCGQSCLNQSWINPSGGLAYWKFNGVYDDSFNIYNGIPSTNLPPFVTGYFGQAVSFDPSLKEAIYTPYIPLKNSDFTIEAWIQVTGYPNPKDNSIVGLCPLKLNYHCLHFHLRREKLHIGFYYNDVAGVTEIVLNRWVHIACTYDKTIKQQTVYLNGYQDGQGTVTSDLLVSSGNFTIGTNEGAEIPDNYNKVKINIIYSIAIYNPLFRVTSMIY